MAVHAKCNDREENWYFIIYFFFRKQILVSKKVVKPRALSTMAIKLW